ncbi:MAG TPA: hypothetical protein VFW06_09085 [Acidimicrobiia bacterium]|nr:hypothetical protein [Acidimicrobiia bacterium]
MLLAELNVRHTRRHVPTRRIVLGDVYLPTSGPAYGAVLLGAVVSEFAPELDEEQRDLLPRLLDEARKGLAVPRIALRYRLQTDTHGLDRSRHRIVGESLTRSGAEVGTHTDTRVVLEIDRHGRPDPQVIGAVLAAAALPSSARVVALRTVESALARPRLPDGVTVRRLLDGPPDLRRSRPGMAGVGASEGGRIDDAWRGIPADRRWAMEVLGIAANGAVDRVDVQARFRRLARLAHPDHGGARDGAAERLAQLGEARAMLLADDGRRASDAAARTG